LVTIGAYEIMLQHGTEIGPLDVTRIFTILTIIGLLNEPMTMLGDALREAYIFPSQMRPL